MYAEATSRSEGRHVVLEAEASSCSVDDDEDGGVDGVEAADDEVNAPARFRFRVVLVVVRIAVLVVAGLVLVVLLSRAVKSGEWHQPAEVPPASAAAGDLVVHGCPGACPDDDVAALRAACRRG